MEMSGLEKRRRKTKQLNSLPIAKTSGIVGSLEKGSIPEAANAREYIESLDMRQGLSAIRDETAREWLKNVHSYQDYRLMLFFYKKGYVIFENGRPTFDKEKLKGKPWHKITPANLSSGRISARDAYDSLARSGVAVPAAEVFVRSNEMGKDWKKGTRFMRQSIALPDSLEMLTAGYAGERMYGSTYGKYERNSGWFEPITLPDGTLTNAFEVRLAQKMRELGLKRTPQGLFFPTGERATLSKIMKGKSKSGGLPEQLSSYEIYSRYLPHLRKMGLVLETDFKSNVHGSSLNSIQLKRKSPGDVMLRSSFGGAKYYFGKGSYIHNGENIPKDTFVATLDASTAGIFEEHSGVKKLMYTFPLFTGEEFEKEKERIALKLNKGVSDLTQTEIIQNARKKLEASQLRNYSATDYISPYKAENPREYAKRIESLSNGEATVNAINSIFMESDLDHLQISWGKKMRLAESVQRIPQERILSFAKEYGVQGLQVLLASEVDRKWPEEVLSYSSKAGMKELFEAYAPLLTDEDEFKQIIDETTFEDAGAREYLANLRRDSLEQVIAGIQKVASGGATLEDVLEKSREGVLAKLAAIKALKREGLLSIKDLRDTRFESVGGDAMAKRPELMERMEAIAKKTNEAYPVAMRDEIIGTMKNAFGSESSHFYLLFHKDKLVSFHRFDDIKNENGDLKEIYFGSFNTDPTYSRGSLGEATLEPSLYAQTERGVPIVAACDPKAPISQKYLEMGFAAEWLYDFNGVPDLHISLDKARNEQLETKRIGREEVMRRGNAFERDADTLFTSGSELPDLAFLNGGWLLTRYFYDQSTKKWYAAFENVGNAAKIVKPEKGALIEKKRGA